MVERKACSLCRSVSEPGTPCVGQDGTRVPFGAEFHVLAINPSTGLALVTCPTCGTPKGSFHHADCRVEECPVCQGAAWNCKCAAERNRMATATRPLA